MAVNKILSEALGKGRKVQIGERNILIRPLTLNDICELEEKYGDLESLPGGNMRGQRDLLVLLLGICSDEKITAETLGAELKLGIDLTETIVEILDATGLVKKDTKPPEATMAAAEAVGAS